MDARKLGKLRQELEDLRRRAAKAADVQSLARRLGRSMRNSGKHPMWVSEEFPKLFPLSIPDHGKKDLSVGTKNSILNQLEGDVDAWESKISTDGDNLV